MAREQADIASRGTRGRCIARRRDEKTNDRLPTRDAPTSADFPCTRLAIFAIFTGGNSTERVDRRGWLVATSDSTMGTGRRGVWARPCNFAPRDQLRAEHWHGTNEFLTFYRPTGKSTMRLAMVAGPLDAFDRNERNSRRLWEEKDEKGVPVSCCLSVNF